MAVLMQAIPSHRLPPVLLSFTPPRGPTGRTASEIDGGDAIFLTGPIVLCGRGGGGSRSPSSSSPHSGGSTTLAPSPARTFNGRLSQLMVFDGALGPGEVRQVWRAGGGGSGQDGAVSGGGLAAMLASLGQDAEGGGGAAVTPGGSRARGGPQGARLALIESGWQFTHYLWWRGEQQARATSRDGHSQHVTRSL